MNMGHDNISRLLGIRYHHGTGFVSLKAYMGYEGGTGDGRADWGKHLIRIGIIFTKDLTIVTHRHEFQ